MNIYKRSLGENVSDLVLFSLVTVPSALLWLTSIYCGGWDAESMSGSCSISGLEGVYDALMAMMLLISFGGFIIVGPIILVFATFSIVIKLFRYVRKQYPRSAGTILVELFTLIPIAISLYLLLMFLRIFWS